METETESDYETEKNELIRLIHTSGDETKKAMIRESLNILDSPRKKHSNGKRLNSHGILFQHANAFETETIRGNFTKSSPIRPLSSKIRRSYSSTETETLHTDQPHHSLQNHSIDSNDDHHPSSSMNRMNQLESSTAVTYSSQDCIQFDDISNVTISGYDPSRMRDWNPFSINAPKWVSTGMIPQSLLIHLKHCWYISEITVIAHGVEEILLSIEGSLFRTPLVAKDNNSSIFIFPDPHASQESASSHGFSSNTKSKIFGDRILLSFEKSSVDFFIVDRIRIEATIGC